jgi:hypothetical protein
MATPLQIFAGIIARTAQIANRLFLRRRRPTSVNNSAASPASGRRDRSS